MDSPDKSDAKAAFRKPSNDASNRKYRRRSSTSPSPPRSGSGSPERRSYSTQNVPRDDSIRITDDGHRRKKDNREPDQTSGRNARSGDSYRHDRHSSKGSHQYRKHDDSKDDKYRDHSKLPLGTDLDLRDGRDRDPGHLKNENEYKRSKYGDRYSRTREMNDGASHWSKHTERESPSLFMEKDMHTREKDARYENRGSRTASGDNRTGRSSYDDVKAGRSDSTFTTKSSGHHGTESDVVDYQNSTREDKNRFDHWETKLTRERDNRGSREDTEYRSRRASSPLKKPKLASLDKSSDLSHSERSQGTFSKTASQPNNINDVDNSNNLDAAKVAAMRAAELVNKNLVGAGVVGALSTDQKKKLLWGNKKKAVEESGHCWDASLFPDREQQEKFNRLMGVKGEVKVEQKAGNPEGKSILDAEKQKELQLDLEKQYTAGLRRRDGRTVGLGL